MDQRKNLGKRAIRQGFSEQQKFKHFHTVLSQRLHRPQHLHDIRFESYPRVSSLDLFKTEGRVK